jgi:RNA polymerase sigma-70 factor (ECF subfamily)
MTRPMKTPVGNLSNEAALLASAKGGARHAFQQLTEPRRRELRLHCYRMIGSFDDAEDLVQDTFLRAWRGFEGFDGRASIRHWLYRITTNVCLDALASRASAGRVLPETQNLPTEQMPDREPACEIPWLEPYPESALAGIADGAPTRMHGTKCARLCIWPLLPQFSFCRRASVPSSCSMM